MAGALEDLMHERDRWEHYHRILIDAAEPSLFSEMLHSHEYAEQGHSHEISISRAYVKVEREV